MTTPPYVILSGSEESHCPSLTLTAHNESQQNCAAQVIFFMKLEIEELMPLLYY